MEQILVSKERLHSPIPTGVSYVQIREGKRGDYKFNYAPAFCDPIETQIIGTPFWRDAVLRTLELKKLFKVNLFVSYLEDQKAPYWHVSALTHNDYEKARIYLGDKRLADKKAENQRKKERAKSNLIAKVKKELSGLNLDDLELTYLQAEKDRHKKLVRSNTYWTSENWITATQRKKAETIYQYAPEFLREYYLNGAGKALLRDYKTLPDDVIQRKWEILMITDKSLQNLQNLYDLLSQERDIRIEQRRQREKAERLAEIQAIKDSIDTWDAAQKFYNGGKQIYHKGEFAKDILEKAERNGLELPDPERDAPLGLKTVVAWALWQNNH